MKIADYGKAITSYIQSPTKAEKDLLKIRAESANRTLLSEGTVLPQKKPKQLKNLFNSIDTAVLSVRSNTIAPEFILPNLEKKTQEYIKEGLISGEDARKFAIERKDYWDKWISENPGGTAPNFEFDNEGKSRILSEEEIIKRINQSDGGRAKLFAGAIPYIPAGLNVARTAAMPLIRKGLEVAAGTGIGKRLSDTFFKKDESDDNKEIIPSDDKGSNIEPPKGPKFDDLAQDFLIEEAVERLKKKEMDLDKRTDKTLLARDLELDVPKSGLYDLRKDEDFFKKRLKLLQKKGVNFDGYYSTGEIANLLGIDTNAGVRDFVLRKDVPMVKKGLYNILTLNDFLTAYEPTKERIQKAPPPDLNTLARSDFLSEVGGSLYQRFKDMRRPKFLPADVKEIYEKYNLSDIEGGHPFPIEFFTKKFGKNNTLQNNRQFDWIYRNKDKLFSKNNLVFQSKEVNKLFRNSIKDLKKLYKELGPYVDKYEGKGSITNQKDITAIEKINNDIIEIIAKSEFDAKKYLDKSDNKVDLERFKTGGLHGAVFNTDTGEVSLYTGVGEGAGFEAISKEPTDVKLKVAGDYSDIINNIITDKGDKEIFTKYINQELLPKFQKGGPVYGKYAKQIAGLS